MSGAAIIEGKSHTWKAPYKSPWLCTPVPARYEAYFSSYTLSRVFLGPCRLVSSRQPVFIAVVTQCLALLAGVDESLGCL